MEENKNLESKIEAILFWKGEPMTLDKLALALEASKDEVSQAVLSLRENFKNRGIVLLENNDEITLGTSPEHSLLIENLQKEELNKELSKAALETLSIVLYKNGVHRAEIDYIRGVNSSFTLRALSIRGLVEKVTDPNDSRKYIYKPTLELFSYLGITKADELPEYSQVMSGLDQVEKNLEQSLKESLTN